jgi:hypothetical protein
MVHSYVTKALLGEFAFCSLKTPDIQKHMIKLINTSIPAGLNVFARAGWLKSLISPKFISRKFHFLEHFNSPLS